MGIMTIKSIFISVWIVHERITIGVQEGSVVFNVILLFRQLIKKVCHRPLKPFDESHLTPDMFVI